MDLQTHHQQQNTTKNKNNKLLFYFPIKFSNKDISHALLFLFLLLSSILFYNIIITPLDPQSLISIAFLSKILPKNSSKTYCDYSFGKWIFDESYFLDQYNENCPFLDPGFRCRKSGRTDLNYQKWRWQPQGCDLPR